MGPNPICMVFFMKRTFGYSERHQVCALREKTMWEGALYKPRREDSEETNPAVTSISDFQSPDLWEINVCCSSPPVWGILLWCPSKPIHCLTEKVQTFMKLTGGSLSCFSAIFNITSQHASEKSEREKESLYDFILKAWPRGCKQDLCPPPCSTSGFEGCWVATHLLKIRLHCWKMRMEIEG